MSRPGMAGDPSVPPEPDLPDDSMAVERPRNATPLVRIVFTTRLAQTTGRGPRVERFWYHVPRIGEVVALEPAIEGEVVDVEWNDVGAVVVLT